MPELPEVETVVRELRQTVVGSVVVGVDIAWPRSIAIPGSDEFASRVVGLRIAGVSRRGKWIVVRMDSGEALLVHLRMTGRLLVSDGDCAGAEHVRVRLRLCDGRSLCFHDVRKFGRMLLVNNSHDVVGMLGPEPLDDKFTEAAFRELLSNRRGRIKPLLMNQRVIVGLGNIYTDEVLWHAGIHPLRRADGLSYDEVARLWKAIRTVLRRAIESGGTTLDDGGFVGATGTPGNFVVRLAVYGRTGEGCFRCGGPIERIVVSQRGTHICPSCQPASLTAPGDEHGREAST